MNEELGEGADRKKNKRGKRINCRNPEGKE